MWYSELRLSNISLLLALYHFPVQIERVAAPSSLLLFSGEGGGSESP